MNERLKAAMDAHREAPRTRGMDTSGPMRAALTAADAPILALIAEAEARRGSSQYCLVTTYELRKVLGMNVDNWHDELKRATTMKGCGDE